MRRRLLVSYLSLILVVLVVLEVSLGALADRHERTLLSSQAVEEANGLAIAAAEDLQHGTGLDALVHRYHQAGGSEVLIVYGDTHAVDSDNDARSDIREIKTDISATAAGRTATGTLTDERHPFVFAVVPIHLEGTTDQADGRVSGELALYLPASAMLHRIHDIWLLLSIFGVAVALIAAVVGARLASELSRPLAALEREAGRLGQGDLTARADVTGPSEIRALAREFNGMADQLQALVQVQSDFVADASHQLRSPLAALRLRLEILERDVSGEALTSVEAAGLEVQRLSRLVDGLLALTKADADHPRPEPLELRGVIRERVEAWAALADERDIRLTISVLPAKATWSALIPGDLEQMLDNYLANAVEATAPGRAISVGLTVAGDELVLSVSDEGIGMSDADMDHAFDRFWQGQSATTGTSGLGLAIVRQLAERNHCRVSLRRAAGDAGVVAQIILSVTSVSDRHAPKGATISRVTIKK